MKRNEEPGGLGKKTDRASRIVVHDRAVDADEITHAIPESLRWQSLLARKWIMCHDLDISERAKFIPLLHLKPASRVSGRFFR